MTESDILAEVIAPSLDNVTAEIAQSILGWRFSSRALERMNELSNRNRRGTITAPEPLELENYLRVGSLINFVQAKARFFLTP